MHVGEGDAGFLEHGSFGEHARASATALRTRPGIFLKPAGAILGREGGADSVLQAEQVGFYGGDVGRGGHGIDLGKIATERRTGNENENENDFGEDGDSRCA
jgi:hypothetical protein